MSQFQVRRRNNQSLRRAISWTSPPRAMSQIVLRLSCITSGLPKPLSVRLGTQWVWRGLSVTLCGMPHVPVHNAENSWLDREPSIVGTLEASSTDSSFAPPWIVAHVYNPSNYHWVPRLLLIAPTRDYLCLKFDPMCDRPHIVGANQE